MPDPVTFTLEADFNFDGAYETDLSAYVDQASRPSVNRMSSEDGAPQVGTMSVSLDNATGIFTPNNSSSALHGKLVQDVPVRLKGVFDSVTYVLFTGYASNWLPTYPGVGAANRCQLNAHDLWSYFVDGKPINVLTSASRDSDGALAAIFTEMGLLAGDQDFDDGIEDFPYHFALNQNPAAAVMDAVRSEMGGHPFIKADGTMRFQNRQARLGTTVADTWGDGTSIVPDNVAVAERMESVVHSVTVMPTIFTTGQADQEVWRDSRGMDTRPTADSLQLTSGVRYEAIFDLVSPVTALTTPEAVVDYTANASADGTGADRTSSLNPDFELLGAAIKVIYAPTADLYVTKSRARGAVAAFTGQRPRFTRTLTPTGARAPRGAEVVLPFTGDVAAARHYPEQLARIYRWPFPLLTLTFKWTNDAITAAMLNAEIGDLIQFADEAPGLGTQWVTLLNDWWYIEGIRHDIRPTHAHGTTVTLVPSSLFRNLDAINFDTFNRDNASGDLGITSSGHTWLNDSGFDIVGNAAKPNTVTEQMPNIDLGSADGVVEVSLSGLAA